MKKIIFVFFIQLLVSPLYAQFFSGKFHAEPSVDDFTYVKIKHHHSPHHKYEGDLTVLGYFNDLMIWESKAKMIVGERADFFVNKFADDESIRTVYEFKIALDGIEEDFILMGYEDRKGHPQFIAVEEVFADESEEDMLSIKSFKLVKGR